MKFLIALLLLVSTSVEAKIWQNAYVSFELPDRWDCKLEGTEYVCSSLLKNSSRQAIIILTAKEIGPSDNLAAYEKYLKMPKSIPDAKGKPSRSAVKHVMKRQINGHTWMDGWHLGSEIAAYYTRYLATTKDNLAILVTFSAHRQYYTQYSRAFFQAIESLRVLASKDLTTPSKTIGSTGTGEGLGGGGGGGGGIDTGLIADLDYPKEPSGGQNNFVFLALGASAIGAYLFIKKRK